MGEDAPAAPVHAYRRSKLATERLLREGYSCDAFLADLVNKCEKDVGSAFDADSVQIDFTEGRLCCRLDPSRGLLRDFVALNNQALARFEGAKLAEPRLG